jgi:hypothetical protein
MSANPNQVPASISRVAKVQLDSYAQAHGVSKSRVIEDALLHHLNALRQLPADVIVPPRLVVTAKTSQKIIARIKRPSRPTKAMLKLFEK